jgi:hypothetical protein
MTFLTTVFLTFCIVLLALLVFRYVGLPVYRVEAVNIKVLLEAVLAETATTADWDVFVGMPIRHDPELDKIRLQCAMLAQTTLTERQGLVIFDASGRRELTEILESLDGKLQVTKADAEHNHE